MSYEHPKLRGKARARSSLYPLGEFTDDIILDLGRQFVHRLAVGHANITGDDFGEMFAHSISGIHYDKPLGITDIIWNGSSWSAKTVQDKNPFKAAKLRLISGRNSPQYSFGITSPLENVQATGDAVLKIWNERVNQSMNEHDDLRVVVLVRNMDLLHFTLFEYEATRYVPGDYEWRVNNRKNLEAFDKRTNKHCFTWQPHGSQFTVLKTIPGSAYRFKIKKRPPLLEMRHVLTLARFDDSWIERVD